MSQSVWPYDHAREPRLAAKVRLAQKDIGNLECFVICPSRPKEYFDDLIALLRNICDQVSQGLDIKLSCNRAIDITSSGLIQPEIWQQIRAADFILADLTGLNGNVLYELGAAAAWHPKERVIVIRERPPEGSPGGAPEVWLSDIQPVRHLQYVRTHAGLVKLAQELSQVFSEMMVAAPFENFDEAPVPLPLDLDLSAGHDPEMLLGPGFAHRRALPGKFLEFGSLQASGFPHSWLTVGNLRLRNVRVKARLSFSKLGRPEQDQPWLGVMLRSQSFWANHGHLAYIRSNGSTWVTVEKDTGHDDEQIGSIDGPIRAIQASSSIDVSISKSAVSGSKPLSE